MRCTLELDVLLLDVLDIVAVVLEQDRILGVETVLEVVSVQDRLELSQKFKGIRDACDVVEILVDVELELSLNGRNTYIELNKISIKKIVAVIEESVVLSLELSDALIELVDNWLNSFKIVLLKSLELLNGSEKINELGNSSAEEVELSEDLVW